MNATLAQINAALLAQLKTLKTANGYATQIEDANIFQWFDQNFLTADADAKYPKCFFTLEVGKIAQGVSYQQTRTLRYSIAFIVKQTTPQDTNAVPKTQVLLEDVDKLFAQNPSLGGVVTNAMITDFYLDGGYAAPEGIVLIELTVTDNFRRA